MRDFDDSTLWRISAYERMRADTGHSGFASLGQKSVLPTTLYAELSHLAHGPHAGDVLEIVAACMRQRQSALVLLRLHGLVWPLTLFPREHLVHVPRPILPALAQGTRDLAVVSVEPAGLRPPGHLHHERVGDPAGYQPLGPLLWGLALHAPRATLLGPLRGRLAFRLVADFQPDAVMLAGALGPALRRLQTDIASMEGIARWPGMDTERAARLLNGVYLQGGVRLMHHHPSARADRSERTSWLVDWWRARR
jgi:hypothetical protein